MIIEVGNFIKAAALKSFLRLNYKNTFFVTVLFTIFKRQKLTDDFLGLHRNVNCTFPLILQVKFGNDLNVRSKLNMSDR